VFDELSINGRSMEGETVPVPMKPISWRRRWDWSRPPKFSKPIAIPAILALLTVLLLAQTIWNSRQRWGANPASAEGPMPKIAAPAHSTPVRTRDPVPANLSVRLYRLGTEPDDFQALGRIGDPRDGPQTAAVADLRIVIEGSFAVPLFPYLFAINPDGTREILFPEEENSAISQRKEFQCPTGDGYLRLEGGLLGLILLGSREALSHSEALVMIQVDSEAWKQSRTGISWLFDGERCEPLVQDRDIELGKVYHGLKAFTDTCRTVSIRPEIAAVRAIAIPVKPASPKP
jgi:hypothetical protein